jgi:hypothetical protein
MTTKTNPEREVKNQAMDDIMVLLEILQQLDDIDLLGRGIEFKMILINRLEEEINKI